MELIYVALILIIGVVIFTFFVYEKDNNVVEDSTINIKSKEFDKHNVTDKNNTNKTYVLVKNYTGSKKVYEVDKLELSDKMAKIISGNGYQLFLPGAENLDGSDLLTMMLPRDPYPTDPNEQNEYGSLLNRKPEKSEYYYGIIKYANCDGVVNGIVQNGDFNSQEKLDHKSEEGVIVNKLFNTIYNKSDYKLAYDQHKYDIVVEFVHG